MSGLLPARQADFERLQRYQRPTNRSRDEEVSVDIPLERVTSDTTVHFLRPEALMSDLETGQSWLRTDQFESDKHIHTDEFERTVREQAETCGKEWGITTK